MAKNKYEIDMLNGPLWGKIIRYAIPLMLSGLLQLFYNAADNIVVGNFAAQKEAALAAVTSTGALINLIVNLFIGLSVGTSIVVANYRGAGKSDDVSKTVHTSVTISLFFGVILMGVGIPLAKPLLSLMSSPDDVIDLAAVYVRIYFIGMPFNMVYNFGSAVLRAVGDTRRPMIILIISGAVNVVLNLIFVILFHLDVAGVALATIIAQGISAVMVVMCLIKSRGDTHLSVRKLGIDKQKLIELTRCGLPAGLQSTLFSISNVLIQSTINSYGTAFVAGNGAACNLEGFVACCTNSMYQAALAFTGQNFGAKKLERIRETLKITLIYTQIFAVAGGLLLYSLGPVLIRLYCRGADESIIAAGVTRMGFILLPYFTCGTMDVMSGIMRGMGKTVLPMIVTLVGVCVVRVLWIAFFYPLNPVPGMLYVSYPMTWTLTSIVHIYCFLKEFKKEKRRMLSKA